MIESLKQSDPSIWTAEYLTSLYYPHSIVIDPTTLLEGEEVIVAERIIDLLKTRA